MLDVFIPVDLAVAEDVDGESLASISVTVGRGFTVLIDTGVSGGSDVAEVVDGESVASISVTLGLVNMVLVDTVGSG